jgi:DNA-cytosine methyltransferase
VIVLSCFDGMSCGQIALERVNVPVDKYYASEIDKYAIKVTMNNYPNTIQLGSITEWKNWDIEQPDIIIGGSPCQGFSFASKQLNFNDERSKLFFIFADILKYYKPKYFLLENVVMKQEYSDVISEMLGKLYPECIKQVDLFEKGKLEPILINSSLVSAQNRERLYWTNIPNILQPTNQCILLKDIIENVNIDSNQSNSFTSINKDSILCYTYNYIQYSINEKNENSQGCRIYHKDKKSPCVCCVNANTIKLKEIETETEILWRKLTTIECERLQTVPDNYTNCVSDGHRYKMLGNGWTVDVISHILKSINNSTTKETT